MLILQHSEADSGHLIALFGVGLIGSALARHLSQYTKITQLPWDWNGNKDSNLKNLSEQLNVACNHRRIGQFSAIWCAGHAGFSATETQAELANFETVLNWLENLQAQRSQARFSFHLTSSTGGLFENQQLINADSTPQALRPYGELKLAQERLLESSTWLQEKHIYRPASVYGYPGPGQRMGLIPTLINNGLKNRVSTIFGHLDTLRDYVLNEDVGRFIGTRVLANTPAVGIHYYLLGTARPASIFEIRKLIERQLQRKIYLQFRPDASANTTNITLSQSALPENWHAQSLESGISTVYRQLLSAQPPFKNQGIVAHG